ncbi:DUF1510 family protein [Peribacillus sp. SCS-155]|uniref:YrrS family protein n=1 Tax=Peribacillus sedimenti TaxID=3115297 RepID=UPI003905A688
MNRDHNSASRFDMKVKQRKINKVYNVLIVVVTLLIVIVGATILLSGGNEPDMQTNSAAEANNRDDHSKEADANKAEGEAGDHDENASTSAADTEEGSSEEDQSGESQDVSDTEAEEDSSIRETEDSVVEVEEKDDPNVDKSYKNEAWKPVGTEQTGEHQATFERNSQDWKEMEKALTYATGVELSNMTLWRLENGGSPDTAIGTLSPKDNSKTFRVHLQWVDGAGWQPVKVQELKKR